MPLEANNETHAEQPKAVRSMDELAALMAENRRIMREGKDASDDANDQRAANLDASADDEDAASGDDADLFDDEGADSAVSDRQSVSAGGDTDDGGGEEAGQQDEEADASEGDGSDEQSENDDAGQDQYEELALADDDLIEIDGLDEPVSFKTLKDTYTADKTVAERVQQTEEQLVKASETYRQSVDDSTKVNEAMARLIESVDNILSAPLVRKPDDALKASNPARYIAQMDAYNADQQRISQSKNTVLEALDTHRKQTEEAHKELQRHEIQRLEQIVPEFRSPTTRKSASKDVLDAAAHFGFQPNEVSNVADARILAMAFYAQQYLKAKKLTKEEKEERNTKLKRRITSSGPRVLRSKGGGKPTSASVKLVRKAKNTAAKSGKPQDVAAFMGASRRARSS